MTTKPVFLPAASEMGALWRTAPGWAPDRPWADTDGDLAGRVAMDLGFDLDGDQSWSLDAIHAVDGDGLPACPQYAVVGGRQVVGKSVTLEIAAVMDVLYLGQPVHIWTAHQFKTARKTFEDLVKRLRRHPDYASRITNVSESHGDEAIEFDGEARIEFHARSGRSGRGFTTGRITMDEAMYVQPGDLGALCPTLVTIEDSQVRWGASGGMLGSGQLRALRDRGRTDTDRSLAYIEHGAPYRPCRMGELCPHLLDTEGCALNDRELWRWCAPGMRAGRVTMRSMLEQREFFLAAPHEFTREFYTWWEDPPEDGDGTAIDADAWQALADAEAEMGDSPSFGVAVAPDRSWAAIAVAWHRRDDGDRQVMLTIEEDGSKDGRIDYRPGTGWVPARIKALTDRWGGEVRVNRAARGLVDGATEMSEDDQAQADNALADAVTDRTVRHGNQAAVLTAIRNSVWKKLGNTRVLEQRTERDVQPLIAESLALAGVEDGGVQFW